MTDDTRDPGRVDTAAPARNFTVTTEERVRALTAGLPAYVRRRRAIEDLERDIVARLGELRAQLRRAAPDDAPDAIDRAVIARFEGAPLARLRDLVERHNRYYPLEANLPMHPRTGALLERGAPWTPLPEPSLEALLARARGV